MHGCVTTDAINSCYVLYYLLSVCYSSICDGVVEDQAAGTRQWWKYVPLQYPSLSVQFSCLQFLPRKGSTELPPPQSSWSSLGNSYEYRSKVVVDVDCAMSTDEVQSDWPTVKERASSASHWRKTVDRTLALQEGLWNETSFAVTQSEASRLTGDSTAVQGPALNTCMLVASCIMQWIRVHPRSVLV